MKFLTLEDGQLGALVDTTVVELPAAATALNVVLPATTLGALVETGDEGAAAAWALATDAAGQQCACRPYADVSPLAPFPVPRRNILCLGKNYLDHAREVAAKMKTSDRAPEKPIIFTKATTAVIAPGASR